MKRAKRGLAVLLAVLLMFPAQSMAAESAAAVPAETTAVSEQQEEKLTEEGGTEESPAVEEGESGNGSDEESQKEDAGQESGTSEETSGSAEPESSENVTEGLTEEQGTTVPEEGSTETSGIETTEENGTEASEETESTEAEEATGETTEEVTEETTEETTETMTEETETEVKTVPDEEILVNTGKHAYSIVGREDFQKYELGDDCFEEDGSYTIKIPEKDPFFPYEVQFSYGDEVTEEWFMTPDDSVEINGHEFFVSAEFSGEVITQMNLNVAGESVVVYPEEKEFTDENDTTPLSLLPLEERRMKVDLTGFSPLELTMVSMKSVFAGERELAETDKIIWSYGKQDEYEINSSGDCIDLAYNSVSSDTSTWQMIVGEADQLASANVRYIVETKITRSNDWLNAVIYAQDDAGNRTKVQSGRQQYSDSWNSIDKNRVFSIDVSENGVKNASEYLQLNLNNTKFDNSNISEVKVFKGKFASVEETNGQEDITEQIFTADMSGKNAGYFMEEYGENWITLLGFDSSGKNIGCLPLEIDMWVSADGITGGIYAKVGDDTEYIAYSGRESVQNGYINLTFKLYKGYPANQEYYLNLFYNVMGENQLDKIEAVYEGDFNSIAEAQNAGAKEVKNSLCVSVYSNGGYLSNLSEGQYFTFFISEEDMSQKVYKCFVKVEEGDKEKQDEVNSGTSAWFYGLRDKEGNYIKCYPIDEMEDSYAEYNYLTILVDKDTDLTALAPVFSIGNGERLYVSGSNTPEISGKSIHDFSDGPVQYTASAENGENAKNYWLQVVKAEEGDAKLYINSLSDADAKTEIKDGIVYSDREIMLDGYHDDIHDILIANMGAKPAGKLSVELSSDTVELDKYWTLSGKHDLSGFSTLDKEGDYGELPNLAKIRLKAKKGSTSGNDVTENTEISGTLTIKSEDKTLMILNLTGVIGDPRIVTSSIPQAVKYVPYGTMIQNNNKYSWVQPYYEMIGGKLPKGMEVRANGEIYGVPQEAGEFTFTVRMDNRYYELSSSSQTFKLTVLENTDVNVDAATDQGYELTQRIQDIQLDATESQTVVSQGVYDEFVDVYLDGKKLTEGEDYTSESGSTRITIRSQTLKASNVAGTHTIGIEFRTEGTDILKRAAQNYKVAGSSENPGGGNNDSGNDGNSGNHDSDDDGGSDAQQGINGGTAVPAQGAGLGGQAVETVVPDVEGGNNGIVTYYTVQRGDTLWKIAEKFYGTGMYWRQIYEDNKNVISNPNRIYAGQELVIRVTTYISKGMDESGEAIYYIVEKGDTLSEIAKKIYGKRRYWRKIYKANKIISDPNHIYVGQRILIPEL